MADLKPHHFDIKVYRKDVSCVYDCEGQMELSVDGVSFGVEDMGELTKISNIYNIEEQFFYISEQYGEPWSYPAYPSAKIGNIVYEQYKRLTDIVEGQKFCGSCPLTGNAIICDNKIKVFPEYHLSFDLQFDKLDTGINQFRSILRLGENIFDRSASLYVNPNTEYRFHFAINYADNSYIQYIREFDVPAMADLKPHHFDIKVYRKDVSCVYDCEGQMELSVDGVSFGVEDMGELTKISNIYNIEEQFFYISEQYGEPWSYPAYPSAKIGNIVYEDYIDVFTTPDNYQYVPVKVTETMSTTKKQTFRVDARNDAHVILCPDARIAVGQSPTGSPTSWGKGCIEIVLGGWVNSKSFIRDCPQCSDLVVKGGSPLGTPIDYGTITTFMIDYNNSDLKVYCDGSLFMTLENYNNYLSDVISMGVSTGWGSTGTWYF